MTIFAPMTKEERQMLCLVRMALWQHDDDGGLLAADADWHAIRQLSEKQTVWPLVATALLHWADVKGIDLPEDVESACMQGRYNVVYQNTQVNEVVAEVQEVMQQAGITPILLKGQGTARLYPHPELRTPGDIDMYLGGQAQRAADLLRPHIGDAFYNDKSPKHIQLDWKGVEIELHKFAVNRDDTPTARFMEPWTEAELRADNSRQVQIGDATVCVPSPMVELVFCFYHLWIHLMMGGIGLRQLCDWAMIVHHCHQVIDAQELENILRQASLLRAWHVLGRFLTDLLGLPAGEMPLYSSRHTLASRITARLILDSGRFGQLDRKEYAMQYEPGLRRKWHMLFFTLRLHLRALVVSPRAANILYGRYYRKRVPHLFD